jgi:poly(A) polymerase
MVMGNPPHDIDIATSAHPDQVMALFDKVIPVGIKYGVVLVLLDGKSYEVTTFRTDERYVDGRHPESVRFATAEEDARRRDFTINGLFYDPIGDQVVDYVGGLEDIKNKIVRTIGDPYERFAEDKLRLMRAIRFACRLEFSIEAATFSAIKELAPQISQVSQERIRDELVKIITGPHPGRGLRLLQESGLMRHILPEVHAMAGVAQPPEFHPEGDVFVHTCLALDLLESPSPVLAMGTLLHDVGKPPTFTVKERIRFDNHVEVGARIAEDICRRLRFSNDETEQIVDLVRDHLRFMHVRQMRQSTLKRFLRKPNFLDHLELHRADCLACHGNLENWRFCRQKLEELKDEEIAPPRVLTGDDLIALGYKPGPLFKEILSAVEDAQLEGKVKTREEAIQLVTQTFPRS